MERIGLYTGSFDPVTFGHVDIMSRALLLVDKLIVAVGRNSNKATMLSPDARRDLLELVAKEEINTKKIEASFFNGLTIDFAAKNNVNIIVRGLRDTSDMDFESGMAGMNYAMNNKIETVFLLTRPKYSFVSSTLVRQVFEMGGDISQFVPKCVLDSLKQ